MAGQTAEGGLGIFELIRAAETLKASGEHAAAEMLYAGWVRGNPDDPLLYAVLFNEAVLLSESGKLTAARECLERTLALKPDFLPARINLGRTLEQLGDVGAAVLAWSEVLTRTAAVNGSAITCKTTALNQIARSLENAGQDAPAEDMLRQSLELDPRQREVVQHLVALRQRQCEWPVTQPFDRVERRLLVEAMSPLSAAAYSDDPLWQLGLAHDYAVKDVGLPAAPMTSWPRAMAGGGPLRIGYLSSDLREHAVGHLMAEVFALHDRAAVEVHAYYCGPRSGDPMHAAYRADADRWTDVSGLDDDAAARAIAADGVQILVDVNGYTRDGRTRLVARRPAPVIVNWLGFPGTMASPHHHYIVADEIIIPPDHERFYTEAVVRLACYQPNNRRRIVADRTWTRAELGLPDEGTVFCCFNGSHKITAFTFDRWLAILRRVPGSVLWLLGGGEETDGRLRGRAEAAGIAPDRLVFAGKMSNPEHLSRYAAADLFLDTTPYGAHTTASDALWTGVPVLTWPGRCFASRVCASLVTAAGIGDLVCRSAEDYVERAVRLGGDRAALADLKARLAAGRDGCTLFDTPGLVRGLEAAYRRMWDACMSGTLPRPDLTGLDVIHDLGCAIDHEAEERQARAGWSTDWRERLAARDLARPVPPRLFGLAG